MASFPVRRKMERDIEAKGGWDAVLDRIRSGETITSIAASFGVSRSFFSWQLNKVDERKAAVEAAKRDAARALSEQALDIADRVPVARDDIAKARLQVEARQWYASKLSPEFRDEAKGATVNVNIGSLHLDALRARAVPLPPAPTAIETTAEVVPGSE